MKLKLLIAGIGAALCLAGNVNTAKAQRRGTGVSVQTPGGSVHIRTGDPYYGHRRGYYRGHRGRYYREGYYPRGRRYGHYHHRRHHARPHYYGHRHGRGYYDNRYGHRGGRKWRNDYYYR